MNKEKKEYVLYKGEKFTVEWYYTEKNKSQPFEYFNSLDSQQQMKLLYLVKRMGDFEKKCQKLPPAEKEKAEKCREDYENRVKGGTYYDNI